MLGAYGNFQAGQGSNLSCSYNLAAAVTYATAVATPDP